LSREKILSITKKDFRFDYFRAGGPGGQNQNKVNSGVRITHMESGATAEARDSRDQLANKRNAFLRMLETDEWKTWFDKKTAMTQLDESEFSSDQIIRSYNMIDQRVVNHITGKKLSNRIHEILNGNIDLIR
jgi:protein subunit release factor A